MRMDIKMEKMSQKALERKSNKPIMEKKRRARINHCLNQLKSLILEADNERSRHSKLEKADILEMTVKYLQTLRAYHVHLNQINQLQAQQQHQQSAQHQQLQHHFQQQLSQNLKLVSPLAGSAPQSPIDLQMPVSLAQLPLPLQLSLQAAAASHQLPQSSPEVSPKSSSCSSSPAASTASNSPRLQPTPQAHTPGSNNSAPLTATAGEAAAALQQAHQNRHLQHQLSREQQHQLSQHLNQLQQQQQQHHHHHALAHHHHHHQQATLSPTWRPW